MFHLHPQRYKKDVKIDLAQVLFMGCLTEIACNRDGINIS